MTMTSNTVRRRNPGPTGGVSTEVVWQALSRASFAIISHVTPAGQPRSSGVIYAAIDRRLYVVTAADSIKARQIKAGDTVAVTVPVRRGGILALLAPIPPATISFHGTAALFDPDSHRAQGVLQRLGSLLPPERRDACRIIEIRPVGRFLTYGIGVGLRRMRDPSRSQAHAPVT